MLYIYHSLTGWLQAQRLLVWLMKFSVTLCLKWKNSRERFSEEDIISTHKKYLFSDLYPRYQQKEQDSRNLWTGRGKGRWHSTRPWMAISSHSRITETPTANTASAQGRSFPSLQQSYPSHQLHGKAKSGQKTCIILHPQLPALLFLFILK